MRGLFEKQQLRSDKETLNLATALAEWQLLMKISLEAQRRDRSRSA